MTEFEHDSRRQREAKERRTRAAFDGVSVVDGQGRARAALAESPGHLVLVVRGVPRSVVFSCPCGCDEVVVVNLDRAVGPPWRLRHDESGLTLMPSVWLTSGCGSHFIVWRSRVWWCRGQDDDIATDGSDGVSWPPEMDAELRDEWRRIRKHRAGQPRGR